MAKVLDRSMTSDAFIVWAMDQPEGRFELFDGEIVRMQAERLSHARVKGNVYRALHAALVTGAIAGEALSDGMAVEIDERTVYEPDALLRCGPDLHPDTVKLTDPVIVVEVVSPSTHQRDAVMKRAGYFRLPSIRHYLIATIATRSVTHHRKDEQGRVQTRTLREGPLALDPPGLTVDIVAFFA
jgi:Uma2 family endonuclease